MFGTRALLQTFSDSLTRFCNFFFVASTKAKSFDSDLTVKSGGILWFFWGREYDCLGWDWYGSKSRGLFLISNAISQQRSFFQIDENLDAGEPPNAATICEQQPSLSGFKVKTAAVHFEQSSADVEVYCSGLGSLPASVHHWSTGPLSSLEQMLISHILFLTSEGNSPDAIHH